MSSYTSPTESEFQDSRPPITACRICRTGRATFPFSTVSFHSPRAYIPKTPPHPRILDSWTYVRARKSAKQSPRNAFIRKSGDKAGSRDNAAILYLAPLPSLVKRRILSSSCILCCNGFPGTSTTRAATEIYSVCREI